MRPGLRPLSRPRLMQSSLMKVARAERRGVIFCWPKSAAVKPG